MPLRTGISTKKIAAAIVLVQILAFTIGIVPEHVSAFEHHDHCEICALIHNPPALQIGQIALFGMDLQSEFMAPMADPAPLPDPLAGTISSRAPPQ